MARDSMMLETDTVDSSYTMAPWRDLAQQLKQDLTSIVLMSEADLQVPRAFVCVCIYIQNNKYDENEKHRYIIVSPA